MGDETMQFAIGFSRGMNHLALLAKDDTFAELKKVHGPDVAPLVHQALDAVEAVYEAGTEAVRDWPEKARSVGAQVAAMREALAASGVSEEVRRMARDLVLLIEPKASERLPPPRRR